MSDLVQEGIGIRITVYGCDLSAMSQLFASSNRSGLSVSLLLFFCVVEASALVVVVAVVAVVGCRRVRGTVE